MDYSGSSLDVLSQNPSAKVVIKSDFFAPGGSPLRVWIETTEVPNHPRIFRRLKANSACVVHDPRDADFFIVNGSSVAGRKLLRDWGNDTSKKFLDFSWVQRSLDARRPLLDADQFGHCRLFDDGRSISDEDDDGLYAPNSYGFTPSLGQLPTPRPTPTTSNPTANVSTPQQSSSSSQPLSATNSIPFNNNLIHPIQSQLMPAHPWPQITNSTNSYHPSSGMVVPFGQQFPHPNNQVLSLLSDPNCMAMFELFCRQQIQQQQYQSQPQNIYQQSANLQQLQPSQHQLPSQSFQNPLPARNLSVELNASISSAPLSLMQPSQPQVKESSNANVQRPLSDTPLVDHHPVTSTTHMREESPAFVEQGPEEWSQTSKLGPPSSRDEAAIFEEDVGAPLKFLVQIQIKNRNQITKSIKRHGGKIISSVSDAHFAILNSRGGDYNNLRKQADYHGVPILNPSFVVDCDAQGTFLNTADYVIPSEISEATHGKKRRFISSSFNTSARGKPYTDEERESFLDIVERTLRSMPNAPNNFLASTLSKKITTHSVGSWLWFCRQNKDEIERVRTEISLEKKRTERSLQHDTEQEAAQEAAEQESEEMSSREQPSSVPRLPSLSPDAPTSAPLVTKSEPCDASLLFDDKHPVRVKQDFDFVRDFFASGAAEDGSEDEIWARMSTQQTCKSASTWKEFCSVNCARIAKEQEDLVLRQGIAS